MKKKPVYVRLGKILGGRWKAVRSETGFGWMYVSDDGRIVRKFASPALTYDGYSDSEFDTYYSDDWGYNRIYV